MFGFGKRKKEVSVNTTGNVADNWAYVFVDYEYWNTSLQSRYSLKPQLKEWLQEIAEIKQGYIYADVEETDFLVSLPVEIRGNLSVIRPKMSEKGSRKGQTAIAMLGGIYQSLLDGTAPNRLVLFAGDGNYEQLLNTCKAHGKHVTLYGVRGAIAENIKDVADVFVEIPVKKEKTEQEASKSRVYETMILKSLSHLAAGGKMATYGKTIANVAKHNHVPSKRIQGTLDDLIAKGYISLEETEYEGKKVPVLHGNWEKLDADRVWEKRF